MKKKRRKVRFNHEKRNLFIFLVFVFFMGMGYSVLGTNLGIGGTINLLRYREPVIRTTSSSDKAAFRSDAYREKIKIINLDDEISPPANVIESWDIGEAQNGNVMAYLTTNQTDNTYYDLYIQGNGHLYANSNSDYLFYNLRGVDAINNLDVLDTSRVTNMSNMFSNTGYNSTSFTLDLGDNFDTSNVTNMYAMFDDTGYNSTSFTLDLGDNFDTSQVTNMSHMFGYMGYKSTILSLNLGDKFDTSQVTNMSYMFRNMGYKSTILSLNLGDKFDTSKAENISSMFRGLGYSNPNFTLDLGDKFDTSNVIQMYEVFHDTGYNSTVFSLDLGDKFNTSKATNMHGLFLGTGYSNSSFVLDLGDKFDTCSVTDMSAMFYYTGYNSTILTIDLGDKFDTSKVTDMQSMFYYTGYNSTTFNLDLGDKFDTSKVTNMRMMFYYAGIRDSSFKLDIGTFTFDSVTNYDSMFSTIKSTNKILVKDNTVKNWLISRNSNLTTSNVFIKTDYYMLDASYDGDDSYFRDSYRQKIMTITFSNSINPPNGYISSWDISVGKHGGVMAYIVQNTTDSYMYDLYIQGDGYIYANTDSSYWFSRLYGVEAINNINLLDTSLTTNMSHMFDGLGENSSSDIPMNLVINFDTSHVTDMSYMFCSFGYGTIIISFGDKFDTRNVTNMDGMFSYVSYIYLLKMEVDLSNFTFNATSYYNMFQNWQSDYKIYVKDSAAQNWIITNGGNSSLTTSNVLIKN